MLLARALGPSEFGVYTLLVFTTTIVSSFGTFGMYQTAIYYYSKNRQTREFMGLSILQGFAGGFLLAAATFLVQGYWPSVFGDISALVCLLAVCNIPFFILGNIFDGMLAGEQEFLMLTSRNSARWAANLIIISILYYFHTLNLVYAIAINLFTNCLGVLLFFRILLHKHPPRMFKDLESVKTCFKHSFQLYFSDLAFLLWLRMDYYFTKAYSSPDQVGIYALVTNINEIILQFPKALYNIVYPRVAHSEEKATELISSLSRAIIFLMLCSFVFLCFFGDTVIRIVGGNEFVGAYRTMLLQYPFITFISIYLVLTSYMSAVKNMDLMIRSNVYGLISLALFNYFLVPEFGINGAAIARSLNAFILLLLVFIPLRRMNKWAWRDFVIIKHRDLVGLQKKLADAISR